MFIRIGTKKGESRTGVKSGGGKNESSPSDGGVLKGHIPVSGTTIHGKSACLLGVPFLGMGVFIVLMAVGVIPSKDSIRNGSALAGALGGGVFGLAGVWLMMHGLVGIFAQRRARRMRERFPDEPWRADHPWEDQGAKDMQGRSVRQLFFGMMFMIVFAAPFNFVMVAGLREGSKIGFVFGCVNFFVAIYVIAFFYRLARLMKYGTGRIAFRRFPFYAGEMVEVDYIPAKRLEGVSKLTCTLRCIKEAFVTSQENGKTRTQIVSSVLHHQTHELTGETVNASHDRCISLSFDVPKNAEPTRLLDRPPVYWQLQISAETSGVNLDSRFLVPVYAKLGATKKLDQPAFSQIASLCLGRK